MRIKIVVGVALAAALGLLSAARAVGAERIPIEPRAESLLKAALGRIAAAQNISFRAEVANDKPLPSGARIQYSGVISVLARRPNGLRITFDGEQRRTQSWYDGKTFTLLSTDGNAYASCAAPDRLEALFPTLRDKLGFVPPLSMLLRENLVQESLERARTGYVVGRAMIRGVATEHLAFRGERVDWQLWVAAEGEPLIRRLVITYREEGGIPQYAADFTEWDFNARLADADFAFSPPAGAVFCEFQPLVKPQADDEETQP